MNPDELTDLVVCPHCGAMLEVILTDEAVDVVLYEEPDEEDDEW